MSGYVYKKRHWLSSSNFPNKNRDLHPHEKYSSSYKTDSQQENRFLLKQIALLLLNQILLLLYFRDQEWDRPGLLMPRNPRRQIYKCSFSFSQQAHRD